MANHKLRSSIISFANKYPRLSPDREAALARLWRNECNRKAADELLNANLRYVCQIAVKFYGCRNSVDELICEGVLGMMHALDKFDPDRGLRFITYAGAWIKVYMRNYTMRIRSIATLPIGEIRINGASNVLRARDRALVIYGNNQDAVEQYVAKQFKSTVEHVRKVLEVCEVTDEPSHDDMQATLETAEDMLVSAEDAAMKRGAVSVALAGLDSRELEIVQARMMVDDQEALTLNELGNKLGITRERVRQLEVRAKQKLRTRLSA